MVNNEWKATVKNVLEQKRSFVLAVTFGGLSIRRKWGNFPLLHLLETMKARGSAEQLHHISPQTLSLPFFYCPALSGCNRQGRKRGKIKIADVSNLSNSSPLKISAGVRCDPSIPARLITQRDKLLWWRFITEQSSYLRFCISHLGLAGKVRLLIMSPTTYPIRADSKKKFEKPCGNWRWLSVISAPNWVQKYWVLFSSWMAATRGVSESDHIGSHLCGLVAICGGRMGAWFISWPCLFLQALVKIIFLLVLNQSSI